MRDRVRRTGKSSGAETVTPKIRYRAHYKCAPLIQLLDDLVIQHVAKLQYQVRPSGRPSRTGASMVSTVRVPGVISRPFR